MTDTFTYDTYGKLIDRTGTSFIIFGYNGRDGVITDKNGLIYMRARYYSPDMKRFINADIVAGKLSNAITLNRFAYANGNPVSFVDPFGLWSLKGAWNSFTNWVDEKIVDPVVEAYHEVKDAVVDTYNDAKEIVVNTYKDVKDWAEENVIEPMITIANDVKFDMQNFDWNNNDEEKVLKSNYFSAYKCQLVIREDWAFTDGRSASFVIMFLNKNETDINTVKHEYGHYIQLQLLGLRRYIQYVAIPSVNSGHVPYDKYYSLPYEASADILGDVQRAGYAYTDGGQGKSFIINTYIKDIYNIHNFINQYMQPAVLSVGLNGENQREK
ncbi:MAG: RHS repeat-associated core domain-containing protein [Clostridia bacterium]|nr:RHS repeat-associated core domain-containing protein [Clostridia bacterium]